MAYFLRSERELSHIEKENETIATYKFLDEHKPTCFLCVPERGSGQANQKKTEQTTFCSFKIVLFVNKALEIVHFFLSIISIEDQIT